MISKVETRLLRPFIIPTTALNMLTPSNGNNFRVTGLLCGEFTGHRWIPRTKAGDAELWSFLWSAPEPTVQCIMETPVIWDAIAFIMTSLKWIGSISSSAMAAIYYGQENELELHNERKILPTTTAGERYDYRPTDGNILEGMIYNVIIHDE